MSHKDPEEARAYFREYARRKRKTEAGRAFYAKNSRRYYHRHKKQARSRYNSWRSRRPEAYLLSTARRRAKKVGLRFNIDLSDIVIPKHCPVLGIRIRVDGEKWADAIPSLDRVDSSKGYIKGNVRVISRRANLLKSNATVREVEGLLRYMRGAA